MSFREKASLGSLVEAYRVTPNVWRVAEQFGMCGQSVYERLTKAGVINHHNHLSDSDKQRLLNEYTDAVDAGKLAELAASMGRSKTTLCRFARQLGLTRVAGRPTPWSTGPQAGERVRAGQKLHGHPRGMLGKRHSPESIQKMCDGKIQALRMKVEQGTYAPERKNVTWRGGWREIGGKRNYYRSRWEANYARFLQWLKERGVIAEWEHEPEVFWFEAIRRGTRSYLPDFRVTETNGDIVYHEVKGWMDPRSKTKINRMKIYHPKVRLLVIDGPKYWSIYGKVAGLIPEWEADPHGVVRTPKTRGISK